MRRLWRSIQLLPRLTRITQGFLSDMHRYDEALAELNRLIAANPEFPVYYRNPLHACTGTWEIRTHSWQTRSWP